MGLRGYGDNKDGPAFVEDVLRVKVTGRTGLHLSIVDLPGLISVASEEQTEADVDTVKRLIDEYVGKDRTIILAVVQASNDIANQSIIKKSKMVDKAGQRTVGIITKPDLTNETAEVRIAALAKNQDTTKLQLGFFLVKNPTPRELEDKITAEERTANELNFFKSPRWKKQNLDANRVGIEKLKTFLQGLLDKHIEKGLPKVRNEIKAIMKTTEQDLLALPQERPTVGHLRMFLSGLAMQYHTLATAALHGEYHTSNADFFATDYDNVAPTRLRSWIHNTNTTFAKLMRDQGQTMKLKGAQTEGDDHDLGDDVDQDKAGDEGEVDMGTASSTEQDGVTEAEMRAWIKKVYLTTRGRELTGNYNHVLLTELFHHQSKNWQAIAPDHVEAVYDNIHGFVGKAAAQLHVEDHVLDGIQERMFAKLQVNKQMAEEELLKLWTDEQQQPITYNHYYTNNVQKSRLQTTEKAIDQALRKPDGSPLEPEMLKPDVLVAALRHQVIVDMDEQACSEALAGLNAYYKVAIKTFVDNVCRQVIERHLLRKLPSIFTPQSIAGYTDEELQRVAGERPETVEKRKRLNEQLESLTAGLNDLRR